MSEPQEDAVVEGVDINDPDFFGEDNLDELAEDVGSMDPAPPPDEEVDDGEDVVEDDAGDDDSGDGDVVADEPEAEGEPTEGVVDDNGRPLDPVELRRWSDRIASENALLKQQLESAQQDQFDEQFDPDHINEVASQDPYQAFRMSLDSGQADEAQGVIARVQADANELAAGAQMALAQANAAEDEAAKRYFTQEYQALSRQGHNATAMAEQMRDERSREIARVERAPLEERNQQADMAAAVRELAEKYPDFREKGAEADAVLNANPSLLGDRSYAEIKSGFEAAYKIVADQPDVSKLVADEVAKALGNARKAKEDNANAVSSDEQTRRAPGPERRTDAQRQREDMGLPADEAGSIGVTGFMNLGIDES